MGKLHEPAVARMLDLPVGSREEVLHLLATTRKLSEGFLISIKIPGKLLPRAQ